MLHARFNFDRFDIICFSFALFLVYLSVLLKQEDVTKTHNFQSQFYWKQGMTLMKQADIPLLEIDFLTTMAYGAACTEEV